MLDVKRSVSQARIATRIAEYRADSSIVYVANVERDAEAIAVSVTAITDGAEIYIPSSDALSGDDAPGLRPMQGNALPRCAAFTCQRKPGAMLRRCVSSRRKRLRASIRIRAPSSLRCGDISGGAGDLVGDAQTEPHVRVRLYARLARWRQAAAVDALEEEMHDRFGPLPAVADTLMSIARLRCVARSADIARVEAGPGAIAFTPRKTFTADAETVGLLTKSDRLILAERIEDAHVRVARTAELLEQLAPVT